MVVLPVVAKTAAKAHVPMAGIEAGVARAGLRKGDSVTALVSHVDGGTTRQWLMFLSANPPEETGAMKQPPDITMYSRSGREVRIAGEASAIAIRVLGPYTEGAGGDGKAKDRWSGTPVNQAFLALGLDRACTTGIRFKELKRTMCQRGWSLALTASLTRRKGQFSCAVCSIKSE